ncbi:flagellar export protein FliJ [Desulfacinum hydrothermale DSM 13146]|uniref:Flagellar FliJ protein n=1 Tax=Desulfacinum hydrothermale DSM 13146 TaxID=1121390 RepID=A0A1W1X5K2_9BACT|nr:flagellar export protein FliJ [Desulfacinum hydrothermale]SMC19239.1 flagellar export protein FliJ [Desulfacinum hydrothermale DSM 13146]
MAFQFRFQKLLEHRKHLVRQAQIELAQALAQVQDLQDRITAVEQRIRDLRTHLAARQRHGVSVAEFLSMQEHLGGLEQQLLNLKGQLKGAERQAAVRREALVEKEREAKKLERLEEIDHERFRNDTKKKEQKFLDESARANFQRSAPTPGDATD